MILNDSNVYLKEVKDEMFVVCIELPDNSRNYMHCQKMILNDCLIAREELIGKTIEEFFNTPYLEHDGTYFSVKMTIESNNSILSEPLYFHSRKLNLNDAVTEFSLLIRESQNFGDVSRD